MSDATQQPLPVTSAADASVSQEVDAVLVKFNGDARAAIAALLHDLRTLALDAEASTSRGYVRGNVVRIKKMLRNGLS
jgi:hypothetical protein